MPIKQEEILGICKQLAEQEHMKVCVTESAKGACIAGGCALLGGLLGGPPGLAVGGIIGSITAAVKGKGKYKSVAEVIMYDMTPSQRAKLEQSVRQVLQDIQIEDVAMIGAMVMSNSALQAAIIRQLSKFLNDEMNLSIA